MHKYLMHKISHRIFFSFVEKGRRHKVNKSFKVRSCVLEISFQNAINIYMTSNLFLNTAPGPMMMKKILLSLVYDNTM